MPKDKTPKIGRRDALKMTLAAPLVLASGRAWAQSGWPSRAVQIAIPFAPSGGGETMARIVFQKVSEILKMPMVIENRPAGMSMVAATFVHGLPRDGHAFLVNGTQQIIVPAVMKDPPLDYRTAFVPVTQLCNYAQCFTVTYDSPIKTLADLVAAGKADPGKFKYGTASLGGMPHLAMEDFQRRANIKLLHIPYKVNSEVQRDLIGGQLDALVLTGASLIPMVQAKRLRIIAVSSTERSRALPDVPTVAESGYPDYEMVDWAGLFAATGTPEPIMRQMQVAVAQAAKDPEVVGKLVPTGTDPVGSTAEEFAKFFERQRETLTRVVKEVGVNLG